jgi:hypothetical protein
VRDSAPCSDQIIPARISATLDTAANLADEADATAGKAARKARRKSKRLLGYVSTQLTRASNGKHPKLNPTCANLLKRTARGIRSQL